MGFRILPADITTLEVDAIVNPTDQYYSGGGGVDYLIHEKCGAALREATFRFPRLHLGEAKATEGFALPCKYIIHTSGPRYKGSEFLEVSLLGSCYRNSIALADHLGCKSIAFPLISSRGKHFPKDLALETALDAIYEALFEYPNMDVILTIYGKTTNLLDEEFFDDVISIFEEAKGYNLDDAFSLQAPMVAEESPRLLERSLIDDLIDNPTQTNLDKIKVDENFAQMLNRLMSEKGITPSTIQADIGISGAGLYKLRKGQINPNKNTVFALAIEFRLSREETEEMLMKAGYAINPSSMQDIILSMLIDNGIYDRYRIDDLLYSLDLQPLPGAILD